MQQLHDTQRHKVEQDTDYFHNITQQINLLKGLVEALAVQSGSVKMTHKGIDIETRIEAFVVTRNRMQRDLEVMEALWDSGTGCTDTVSCGH